MGVAEVDWERWLTRWDAQQEGYVPEREERFAAMFDALAGLVPTSFVALDLAGGPGSLSRRLLDRFPGASMIAVDMDPVMLALGRGAAGPYGSRLRFVEADLADPGWAAAIGDTRIDAVLSSTALHWLWPAELTRVYQEVARLLAPGAPLLNGDTLAFGSSLPTIDRLARSELDSRWTDQAFADRGIETAEQWWQAIAEEPALAEPLAARERLLAVKRRQDTPPDHPAHVDALHAAGFAEVATIWQSWSDRVLLAIR